jgi:hypothetical protein
MKTETVRRSRLLLIFFKAGAGDYIGEKEGVEHGNINNIKSGRMGNR